MTAKLALNQATVRRLSAPEAITLCARHGIGGIGLWRDAVADFGLAETAAAVRAAGLHVSSLCRGGFFTAVSAGERAAAATDNRAAVDEAAALGADALILVSGGLPAGSRDLAGARAMIADGIGALVPYARQAGVRLGIEALHPMFCADRCAISTLGQALDLACQFPAAAVGVVIDAYHLWWDPDLLAGLRRSAGRIVSYQVSDWVLPLPADTLLGRGHVGDGRIDFGPITSAVAAAGYDGYTEVEIFNQAIWAAPAEETVTIVKERFARIG